VSTDNIVAISLDMADKFNFHWNIWFAFFLGFVAWMASIKKTIDLFAKIIISIAIAAILCTNLLAIHISVQAQIVMLDELLTRLSREDFVNKNAYAEFVDLISNRNLYVLAYILHVLGDIFLLVLVWNGKIWSRLRHQPPTE